MSAWIHQATLEEIREYRISTRKLLNDEDYDLFRVIGVTDSRLADIANHVSVCHRCLAEYRAKLDWCFFSGRRELESKIKHAGNTLDEVLEIQRELIDVRQTALAELAKKIGRMDRLLVSLSKERNTAE